jgi:hypothetical protein
MQAYLVSGNVLAQNSIGSCVKQKIGSTYGNGVARGSQRKKIYNLEGTRIDSTELAWNSCKLACGLFCNMRRLLI